MDEFYSVMFEAGGVVEGVRAPAGRNGLFRCRCSEVSVAKVSLYGIGSGRERLEAPVRGRTKPWADVVSAHP